MRRILPLVFATLVGFGVSFAFAQALPGQANGRISRHGTPSPTNACPSGQYADAIDAGGLVCAQVAYSQISGCVPASGANTLQYDSAGCLTAVTNVTSDGTHTLYTAETLPAAPTAGSMAFDLNGTLEASPMRIDSFMGIPTPVGFFRGSTGIAQIATSANWAVCSNYPSAWNSTSMDLADGTCPASITTTEGSAVSGGGWDAGTDLFIQRIKRVGYTATLPFAYAGVRRTSPTTWYGNQASAGGFVFWTRVWMSNPTTGSGFFAGLAAGTGAFNPQALAKQPRTIYIGCDTGDSNLTACGNGTGTAACSTLGASFPCKTANAAYDIWLAAAPQAALPDAGTGVSYYVQRLDSPAATAGTITTLPENNFQLAAHVVAVNSDAGAPGTLKIEISGITTWDNW